MVRMLQSAALFISLDFFNPDYPQGEEYLDQTFTADLEGNFVSDESNSGSMVSTPIVSPAVTALVASVVGMNFLS